MNQDKKDRLLQGQAGSMRKSAFGTWQGQNFHFNSPEDEHAWNQQAYRQSVAPDRWQSQQPVDDQTQTMLDSLPHLSAGQFFRGPDGKHRRITMAQREDKDIEAIRRKAFNTYAQSGVTFTELDKYPEDKPHPGEEEALALLQQRRLAANNNQPIKEARLPRDDQALTRTNPANDARPPHETRSEDDHKSAPYPHKIRDMGELPKNRPDLTRISNVAIADNSAAWNQLFNRPGSEFMPQSRPEPEPVLVAASDRAVIGLPKEVQRAQPYVTPSRTTPGQRRAFNERLIGRPANDNQPNGGKKDISGRAVSDAHPPMAPDNSSPTPMPNASAQRKDPFAERPASIPVEAKDENSESATEKMEWETANRLFNWRKLGKEPPAPREYAIHVASEEGRFTYLEEQKNEWSRLIETDPEKVFRSMVGEAEKLSTAAQKDFYTAHHELPTPAQVAEINDAIAKIVFAPAESWSQSSAKPYFGIIEPVEVTGTQLADVFAQAAQIIAAEEKFGGRPGSKDTRDAVLAAAQKIIDAIKACGGKADISFYGKKEKFIPKVKKQILGGSYPDVYVPFEYNGKPMGVFVNHTSTYADGRLKPNEGNQIDKLVNNVALSFKDNSLKVEAVGIGYFPKRKKKQSQDDYMKEMDDFIKKLIDCKRPFLIRVHLKKAPEVPKLPKPANDNNR